MYNETEYMESDAQLNKSERSPDSKKYKVFIKDSSTGDVNMVDFNNPNIEIEQDNSEKPISLPIQHNYNSSKDNKTPRHWSSKFWSKKNVSDILKEIIEPESVDVTSIQMQDTLCPLIWDDNENLKNDVRKALLLNTKRFIEFSDAKNLKFNDIILTGSMANYNYNENSDLDIHIIIDFSQISENEEFVGEFLKLKKQLWREIVPIQVKGFDVEMYFQNTDEVHHATGTYSLINDEWINKPLKKIVNINSADVQLKSADFMNAIDDLESNNDKIGWMKNYEQLKNKIKKYRQTGLDNNGEYSVENLVFKILRNSGYLAKLVDLKNEYLKNELTLNEFMS